MKSIVFSSFLNHIFFISRNWKKSGIRFNSLPGSVVYLMGRKTQKTLPILIIGCFFLTVMLSSCSENSTPDLPSNSCIECHKLELDKPHRLPCTSCHLGNSKSRKKDAAHFELVQQPSHPDNMAKACGSCHADFINNVLHSLHFTLNNSTNLFRKAFGAKTDIATFIDTSVTDNPNSTLELADDLLRRRCFRCHPYSKGDDYPAITRGTGCASCHLSFTDGKLLSHTFQSPQDNQCLSCHYGNYVGSDYYGRFEHDFNDEYRTPYTTKEKHFRPFGIEYHQLKPDIHQIRGMVCIDCHSGESLMKENDNLQNLTCQNCHLKESLNHLLPVDIKKVADTFILYSKTGKKHLIPVMKHAAHFNQMDNVACQVCHAQWTYGDYGKHFLRSDLDDFDPWYLLTRQASSEIENILTNNMDFEKDELPPTMSDKITGTMQPGLWYKGFTKRRWDTVLLGRNTDGTITTIRPMLDFKLSWIDEDEEVRFDSVSPLESDNGFLPYTPHTTGSAGIFYNERIRIFLENEKRKPNATLPTQQILHSK
jgi:hypothetical protein